MPSDVLGWAGFGLVYGGIVGLAGNGGVLGFAEGAAVTGILWAIFGLIAGTLYGIGPADPIAFAVSILILLLSTIAAIIVPARRAATVDPADVLKQV